MDIKCYHSEIAYSQTRVWCDTCGAPLDPEDTTKEL